MKEYKYIYNSKLGNLIIRATDKALLEISYYNLEDEILSQSKNKIIEDTINQLEEYFANKRKKFDLPIEFSGTEFQIKVWKNLLKVPYGETKSYKDIAKMIGNEKAVRAVGGANNKNKISIVVPCHRIVGQSGKLIGYAGGLDKKDLLLKLESKN
ncbi:methylated-DNA--[protein]-cysteine S-methyltransferase [uncultured Clostridium sp.]|jgi:methylated-DNA-[protein]-cysteine S-methyltransferase|uniref:methylated-DNA--[protein]-cysteine S-methyltransferase n=1 Tax=uncultured Clostridium sp. TaxID=59620 RepID=UPI00261AFD7F|nr:methylated-DNA--[protein]-cysteine S-methyltransferase [uncultured Clostridium sp.]